MTEGFETVLVPELNFTGQFANLVGAHLGRPVEKLNQVTGLPMPAVDIYEKIMELAG